MIFRSNSSLLYEDRTSSTTTHDHTHFELIDISMGREGNYYQLVIEQARTAEDLRQMMSISAACHGEDNWSLETFYKQMYGSPYCGGIYARVKDEEYAGILVWTLYPEKGLVDITNVGVAPAFRKLGVAKLMFEVFMNALYTQTIYNKATLHVAVTNFPALSLYTKFGFEIRREIPGYYSPGDAYMMKAYINSRWPYSCEVMEEKEADSLSLSSLAQSLNDLIREGDKMQIEYQRIKYADDSLVNNEEVEYTQHKEIMSDPDLKIKRVTFRLPWAKDH